MAFSLSTVTLSSGTEFSSPSSTSAAPSTLRTISATSAAMARSCSTSGPVMFTEMPEPVSMEMSMVLVCTEKSRPMSSAMARMSRAMAALLRPASESTIM